MVMAGRKQNQEFRDELKEVREELKNTEYLVVPDGRWRERSVDFLLMLEDGMADVIYTMAKDGADWNHIANYFSADQNWLKIKFAKPFTAAKAELAMAIRKHTIQAAFNSKMPVMTIWAGKQFAGLSDDNAGLISGVDGAVQLNVSVVRKQQEPMEILTEETIENNLPGIVH